jgi:hypothetical protein
MKKIVTEILSTSEQEFRVKPLNSDEDLDTMMQEAHYVHTINDFVELIVVYGYEKVIGDLRIAMGDKTW